MEAPKVTETHAAFILKQGEEDWPEGRDHPGALRQRVDRCLVALLVRRRECAGKSKCLAVKSAREPRTTPKDPFKI